MSDPIAIGYTLPIPRAMLEDPKAMQGIGSRLMAEAYTRLEELAAGRAARVDEIVIKVVRHPDMLGALDFPYHLASASITLQGTLQEAPGARQELQEEAEPAPGLTFPDRPIPGWLAEMIRQEEEPHG